MIFEISQLHKSFGQDRILHGISAEINPGEVIAMIGPSGAGKSTLLRCLNGLEIPTEGKIFFHGRELGIHKFDMRALREKVGMVFQHFNLFPHMTLIENVTYAPIKVKKQSKEIAYKKGKALLKKVGLLSKKNAYPQQLSGGQRQRAAIARALAMEPEVILFDEPTSALDPEMVQEVLDVLKSLAHTGITMILSTHEMGFAREVADRIWFLDKGHLIEDKPCELFFQSPQTKRAKEFLGRFLK